MKKIEKLRFWLIHKLGGFTRKDVSISKLSEIAIILGFIKNYMDSIYGSPADEWCKNVYSFINEGYCKAMESIDDNHETTNGNKNKESEA